MEPALDLKTGFYASYNFFARERMFSQTTFKFFASKQDKSHRLF